MSEIKGQLLGIILTLMVFAAVSVTIAAVYKTTAGKVTQKANNIENGAQTELNNSQQPSGLLHY